MNSQFVLVERTRETKHVRMQSLSQGIRHQIFIKILKSIYQGPARLCTQTHAPVLGVSSPKSSLYQKVTANATGNRIQLTGG